MDAGHPVDRQGGKPGVWFERRPAGRGIRPASWKGWALVVVYLGVLFAAVIAMPRPDVGDPVGFAGPLLAVLTVIAIATIVFVLLVRRRTAAG